MTTERMPVTADSSLFTFYDIESLSNTFTMCAYTPRGPERPDDLEVFFLVDDDAIDEALDPHALYESILASNPGLPAVSVMLWNLRREKSNLRLAELIGLSDADQVCDPKSPSSYPDALRLVCDTDGNYDASKHPFLAGYNSQNYDTTMLALYLHEVFPAAKREHEHQATGSLFQPTTAKTLRQHNDRLFSADYIDYMPRYLGWDSPAGKIRQSMLRSGRHLDVAQLNEQQKKVALKRLLGMLGLQILESDKLDHDSDLATVEELYELLAYNVSDCLGLSQLFEDPTYSSAFDLKAGLLEQYPETRFTRGGQVRRDRLSIDTTSAKFVARILSPYGVLDDIETVSFSYPHPEMAAELGVEVVNVLDECVRFFEERVAPDRATDDKQAAAHQQFMEVVEYYRSIEGKNFNDSEAYHERYPSGPKPSELKVIPKRPNNVPYFRADGSPSSCFATFSYGGIHGAEADIASFEAEGFVHREHAAMIRIAKLLYPKATDFRAEAKRQHETLRLPDGSSVDKALVLIGSDPEKVRWRKPKKGEDEQNEQLARAQAQVTDPAELLATQRPEESKLDVVLDDGTVLEGKVVLAKVSLAGAEYREEPAKKAPQLFSAKDDGATKLHPKYARTSAGMVIHEDFTSYYPNLLRNMRAFYNPSLGEDRYAKIFFEKERLSKEMKDPDISAERRAQLATMRNGTKLILNSACGAGDTTFGSSPIRMNNTIISMRIIGQLFSWRIGQAQTLAGGRIISTNTDGLYSVISVSDDPQAFTSEVNNRVLAEQQAAIGIDIEPEPLFLISKDSNNRLELGAPKGKELAWTIEPDSVIRPDGGFSVDPLVVHAAGGGSLACWAGPSPTKALSHPAVIDFALVRYLQAIVAGGERALSEPFDEELGRKILSEAIDPQDLTHTATMFQNVLAASRGKVTYPFAADPLDPESADSEEDETGLSGARGLQAVNRVFIVRRGTPGAVSLHAAGAWAVPADSRTKRQAAGEATIRTDATALRMLRHHGWVRDRRTAEAEGMNLLPTDQDVSIRRITGIDPSWPMLVYNDDLHAMDPARLRALVDSLDLEVYLRILGESYTKNWRNA